MNIDISREQKEALAQKVEICVEFIKNDVQPYLTSKDNLVISIADFLDFCLTNKEFYIRQTRVIDLSFFDMPLKKIFYLEKNSKTIKKYICTATPELAIEFLKQWGNIKRKLKETVINNTSENDTLNNFIDTFTV